MEERSADMTLVLSEIPHGFHPVADRKGYNMISAGLISQMRTRWTRLCVLHHLGEKKVLVSCTGPLIRQQSQLLVAVLREDVVHWKLRVRLHDCPS